ncbi:MAG: hypothetical protein RJP95_00305 [Pirellulales bacterium]
MQAVQSLTAKLKSSPQNRELFLARAQEWLALNMPKLSILDLTKAIELSETQDEDLEFALSLREEVWLILGEEQYAAGDREMLETIWASKTES